LRGPPDGQSRAAREPGCSEPPKRIAMARVQLQAHGLLLICGSLVPGRHEANRGLFAYAPAHPNRKHGDGVSSAGGQDTDIPHRRNGISSGTSDLLWFVRAGRWAVLTQSGPVRSLASARVCVDLLSSPWRGPVSPGTTSLAGSVRCSGTVRVGIFFVVYRRTHGPRRRQQDAP
jgi:hypothetical protein